MDRLRWQEERTTTSRPSSPLPQVPKERMIEFSEHEKAEPHNKRSRKIPNERAAKLSVPIPTEVQTKRMERSTGFSAPVQAEGVDRRKSCGTSGASSQMPAGRITGFSALVQAEGQGNRINQGVVQDNCPPAEKVDLISVGRLASLLKAQGYHNYEKIDLTYLSEDLRALLAWPRLDFDQELDAFWTELGATLRRQSSRSRSHRRSRKGGNRHNGRKHDSNDVGGTENGDEMRAHRADVERFIKQNKVDENAAEYFRKSSPDIQRYAIQVGTLRSARNPSSALMRRLLDLRKGKEVAAAAVSYPGIGAWGMGEATPAVQTVSMISVGCNGNAVAAISGF